MSSHKDTKRTKEGGQFFVPSMSSLCSLWFLLPHRYRPRIFPIAALPGVSFS
jgi:hypothetical protein